MLNKEKLFPKTSLKCFKSDTQEILGRALYHLTFLFFAFFLACPYFCLNVALIFRL